MPDRTRRTRGYIIVTDAPCPAELSGLAVRTADEYLEGDGDTLDDGLTVVNLCRSYDYLTKGYYVSLLAEARRQRVLPSLDTIADIHDPFVYFRSFEEAGIETIDYKIVRGGRRLLPRVIIPADDDAGGPAAAALAQETGTLRYHRTEVPYTEATCIMGKTADERFRRACSKIFKVYPVPLLKVRFYEDVEEEAWLVGQVFPTTLTRLGAADVPLLAAALAKEPRVRPTPAGAAVRPNRIACLWDEDDPYAPSDEATLEKFERVAEKRGALFEIIDKDDLAQLAEYDALFIRTVTAVEHYSFTFAQAAESLGLPVIDDPHSIIRCSNKVFLHELFAKHGIPTPRTAIVSRKSAKEEVPLVGFPVIVKLPDGTFSHAVKKAKDWREFERAGQEMFKRSPLLIVQEFTPTAFDWRIGVLEGRILFAAKYHMAKDHWQIVGAFKTGRRRFGKVEAVPIDGVPEAVRQVAVDSAQLIGNGLYGVDVKDTETGPRVIEINDNPNILETDEDAVEKNRIYEAIIESLLRRIEGSWRSR